MSALDTARKAAEAAQAHLRDAQARAEQEAAARDARNAEARAAFWEDVRTDALPAAQQALTDAREGFGVAVAEGGDVAAAYVRYARAHETHKRLMNATCDALVTYINDRTMQPHDEQWGRPVYPPGLRTIHDNPETFVAMFERATRDAADAHAGTVMANLRADLAAVLEPEDDR